MSEGGRDLAKGMVLTLVPTGLGFILSGWIVGVGCLFVAGSISLVLWTPVGTWLGFQADDAHGGESHQPASLSEHLRQKNTASVIESPSYSGRIYGGAEIGAAIRSRQEEKSREAAFLAVEAEIALAYEEALEMAKILRTEWPHITPDGAVVQVALPDWRAKTTTFIGTVLGSAQRAAFKGSGKGDDELERLESEGEFLRRLATGLTHKAIRLNETEILKPRAKRREHEAACFLNYGDSRIPGAPDP
jgi:hypothetical protein